MLKKTKTEAIKGLLRRDWVFETKGPNENWIHPTTGSAYSLEEACRLEEIEVVE